MGDLPVTDLLHSILFYLSFSRFLSLGPFPFPHCLSFYPSPPSLNALSVKRTHCPTHTRLYPLAQLFQRVDTTKH